MRSGSSGRDAEQGAASQASDLLKYFCLGAAIVLACVFVAPQLRFGEGPASGHTEIYKSRELAMSPTQQAASLSALLSQGPKFQFEPRDRIKPEPKPYILGAKDGPSVVPVDLARFLGYGEYYGGVSFDAFRCGIPLKTAFPQGTDAEFTETISNFAGELKDELAKVLNIEPSAVDIKKPVSMHFQPTAESLDHATAAFIKDPRHGSWIEALSLVMSKYLTTNTIGQTTYAIQCGDAKSPRPFVKSLSDLGKVEPCPGMSPSEVRERTGYHAIPFISIETIAHDALMYGCCTKPPQMADGFGQWVIQERMFKQEWKTFDVESADEDHVLFLFDILYEKHKVFSKQYWLGVATMQNPFDMMSIANIIYEIKPDLLIETGTANGGSALLWSTVFELSGMHDSKIITIDITKPSLEEGKDNGFVWWEAGSRENPTQKSTWKKYVTFLQGGSTSPEILAEVRKAAAGGKKVLVLLDSAHGQQHVTKEMMSLCPLVSLGSYCIVQDTKMSRWSSDGPLESVRWFLDLHPDFESDRSRELMYTHHPEGYVRRIKNL